MGCGSSASARATDAVGKPIVTLTGISGYLGSLTCLEFIKDGGYRVRGTVRDKDNQEKLAPLRAAFGAHFDKLELVNADLLDEQSLITAIKGSTYVVHLASPFFSSQDEDVLVRPAVEGTTAVMKACQLAGVRRCVVTSSCASIFNVASTDKPADGIFTEAHWSNPDRPEGIDAYSKSKTLAEKAAWDFQAALPADKRFEVVTINPGFVMGPPLSKQSGTSIGYISSLMTG